VTQIAVIHTGAVGDLVQALPALAAVREAYPSAAVTFVGRPERGALARAAGAADACVDLETSGLWRSLAGDPCGPCPAWLADADLVLDFLTKGTLADRHGVGRRVVTVDPLPPDGFARPAAAYVAEQVRAALGLPPPRDDDRPAIPLGEAAMKAGREALASCGVAGRFVAIHPGSGSARKNWPLDRFEALARRVRDETGRPVAWLTGPAEQERGTVPAGGETVLGDLSLVDVAAVCALAEAYVGNDSGITQIAAAVRPARDVACGPAGLPGRETSPPGWTSQPGHTPVVALFGPTDPQVWAPRGRHVRVVRSSDSTMDGIAVEPVWEATQAAPEPAPPEPPPPHEPPP